MVKFTKIGTVESYEGRRGVLYIANDEIPSINLNSLKTASSVLELESEIQQLRSDNEELIEANEYLRREVVRLLQKQRITA